jgi:V/A-type H+-transporting ATPase subunit E
MTDHTGTSGVQDLIDRLSQEGVAEGQKQAEQIVGEAERKADGILESARQQANHILKEAREQSEQYQVAGEEALRLAARDAVRDFGSRVHDGLRNRLQELVQQQLKEPKLIKRMILEITRQATEGLGDEQVEVLLSPELITEEDARHRIQSGQRDVLTEFVQGLLGEDLREGFTVDLGNRRQGGLTVRVVNQNVEIDLTEESISEHLAQHLLPRFRAIMRKA